jgi:hypothetical protein
MVYQSQDQVHVSEAAMIALHDLSAHELSTAYRTRRLSPVEVTRAATGGTCLATAGGLRYPNPP